MEITKEYVSNRINQLKAQKENALGTLHAIDGAIQECRVMLKEIEKEEPQEPGMHAVGGTD